MEKLDRITVNPNVCLGQPTVRGMRITVSVILKMLGSAKSTQAVLEAYPELEAEDVQQSLKYAAWVVERANLQDASSLMAQIRLLADMNISPQTVTFLQQQGWDIPRVSEG